MDEEVLAVQTGKNCILGAENRKDIDHLLEWEKMQNSTLSKMDKKIDWIIRFILTQLALVIMLGIGWILNTMSHYVVTH